MRRVLLTALMLLAAVLLRGILTPSEIVTRDGERPMVRVLAQGAGTRPTTLVLPQRLCTIWTGHHRLGARGNQLGALVATLEPDGDVVRQQFVPLEPRTTLFDRITAHSRPALPGEVFVVALRGGHVTEPDDSTTGPGTLAQIGARLSSWSRPTGSAILVTRRTDDGWETIREASSRSHGLDVSIDLAAAPQAPDRHAIAGRTQNLFGLAASPSDPASPAAREILARSAPNGAMDAYAFAPAQPGTKETVLRFEDVELAGRPEWTAFVGLSRPTYGRLSEATFRLQVDGRVIATRRIATHAGESPKWTTWSVSLPELTEGPHILEVVASPANAAALPRFFIGAPQLNWDS